MGVSSAPAPPKDDQRTAPFLARALWAVFGLLLPGSEGFDSGLDLIAGAAGLPPGLPFRTWRQGGTAVLGNSQATNTEMTAGWAVALGLDDAEIQDALGRYLGTTLSNRIDHPDTTFWDSLKRARERLWFVSGQEQQAP